MWQTEQTRYWLSKEKWSIQGFFFFSVLKDSGCEGFVYIQVILHNIFIDLAQINICASEQRWFMFVKLFIRAAILSKYVQSIGGCKKKLAKWF